MKINKFFSIKIAILLTILTIIVLFAFPWIAIYIDLQLLPNPPRPKITYGEFPFRLEYEINGKIIVVKDTLICEYDGVGINEGEGKYRKWKERLASGNKKVVLLKINDSKEIYYDPGDASYYMGDLMPDEEYTPDFPDAGILERQGGIQNDSTISADELLKRYNIKLISWNYSKPIKNNFSTTKK